MNVINRLFRVPIWQFALATAGSLICAAPALGEALPACPSRPITFAFYEMGYMYNTGSGAHSTSGEGIDRDLLDELIKRSGCKFDVTEYARARTWHELETGRLDMASAAAETPARDKFAWFAFYMIGKQYLLLRAEAPASVRTMDDLWADKRLKLGVVRSFAHGDCFDDYVAKLRAEGRVVDVVDQDALYNAVMAGKVDAIFGLPFVYPYYFDKYHAAKQLRVLDLDPTPGLKHGIVMSNKTFDEAEAKRWMALVDGIRRDGTMRKIVLKYLDPVNAERVLNF